jgi:hypothetical protein
MWGLMMTIKLEIPPDREAAYRAQAQAVGLSIEQWFLELAEESTPETVAQAQQERDPRPIWEVIADNMKDVPPEDFDLLPRDGASEHDHYLYGHPKRNP